MKPFSLLVITLVFLFNLVFVPTAWAGSKLSKNPDYIELNETLTQLIQAKNENTLPAGISNAEVDKKITELRFQKYIIENGKDTQIINQSGQPLAIYGPKAKKSTSTFDNVLYLLPDGEETDDDAVFEGIYLPSDAKVSGVNLEGAVAFKFIKGSKVVITSDPVTGNLEFNVPVAKVYKPGEINWEIPDLTSADLASKQIPEAAID